MKLKTIFLSLIFCMSICIIPQKTSAQGGSVSFQVFYDDLSPYGTWVNSPQYGYVWMPNVSTGFTPYSTNGYWTFTDEGWTWVSNYPWGWAPFHYGRWYNDAVYGPMWVPGNEWGPGWVSWRSSGSYYGWAPMGPGVSIDMAYGSGYYDTYNQYTFVRCGYMGRSNIYNYYESSGNNVTIINNTTVINNNRVDKVHSVTYSAGPQRIEVEKRIGKPVVQVAIKESNKHEQIVSNNQLQLYRPQVQKKNGGEAKPAPTKVADLKDTKTISQRKAEVPVQKINQPTKTPSAQPQRTGEHGKSSFSQPQQGNPSKRSEGTKPSEQARPALNMDGQKQPEHKAQPIEPQHQQPLRNSLPPHREQPTQPQNANPPRNMGGEKQPQHNAPPNQQPQRMVQPNEPQHSQPQRSNEPPQQQPQRANPPQNTGGEQRPQHMNQPNMQQPAQPQRNAEPPRQQPEQPRAQPQPQQPQRNEPQRTQPQQNREQQQPQRSNPPQNMDGGKRPH